MYQKNKHYCISKIMNVFLFIILTATISVFVFMILGLIFYKSIHEKNNSLPVSIHDLAPKIEKIEQPSIERSRQMRHHNSQVNQKIFKPGYSFS